MTRPGIAPIASALLVELLVSILQHPLGARAPAPAPPIKGASHPMDSGSASDSSKFVHPLGALPHQLRGFLSSFSTLQILGSPYSHCSACSDSIISAYQSDGWSFVKKALSERGYVEELSGLAEVQRRAEELDADVDWSEDDGEDGDGELL